METLWEANRTLVMWMLRVFRCITIRMSGSVLFVRIRIKSVRRHCIFRGSWNAGL